VLGPGVIRDTALSVKAMTRAPAATEYSTAFTASIAHGS
jgi:hypothetical protein